MPRTLRFKVVLLGEGRVGKTSILLRYVKGERVPASTFPGAKEERDSAHLLRLFFCG